jgi:hypothetical protein
LQEYGDLGRLIESGVYYVPEPPDIADYDLVTDPYGLLGDIFGAAEAVHETLGGYVQQQVKVVCISMAVSEPRNYGRTQEAH